MKPATSTQKLVEMSLGRDLHTYVKVRQAEGMGWRKIASDIRQDTGLVVSHEAIRSWFVTKDAA